MLHGTFNGSDIAKQVGKFAERIGSVNIDAAVEEALNAVADWALEQMQAIVAKHTGGKGDAFRALRRSEVHKAGNEMWVEVGGYRIRMEDKAGFHLVFLEYGSVHKLGHRTLKADPWLRPTMERKAEMRKIVQGVFEKWGVQGGA